jgi:hypothetical protein
MYQFFLICLPVQAQQNKICEDQVLFSAQKNLQARGKNISAVKTE